MCMWGTTGSGERLFSCGILVLPSQVTYLALVVSFVILAACKIKSLQLPCE